MPQVRLRGVQATYDPVALVSTDDAPGVIAALRDSASSTNYPRFAAALADAKALLASAHTDSQRDSLQRAVIIADDIATVWTFANTDRFGAFYDNDAIPGFHERLTASYRGYATAIESNSITDRNGHVFYPSSETRLFLASQIAGGSKALPPLVARSSSSTPKTPALPRVHTKIAKAAKSPLPAQTTPVPKRRRVRKADTTPVQSHQPKAQPPHIQPQPATQVATAAPIPASAPAPVAKVSAPAPQPAPVPAPQPAAPKVAEPQPAVVEERKEQPEPQPATASGTSNAQIVGVLFVLMAIIGVGAVSAFLRAPKVTPTIGPIGPVRNADEPEQQRKAG